MPAQIQFLTPLPTPVESDTPACHLHENAVSEHCFLPSESEHLPGQQAPFLSPDDSIYYDLPLEQPYPSHLSTVFGSSAFHVNCPTTAAVFGHEGGVQSTENCYDLSFLEPSYLPDAGFIHPAQPIPSMDLVQATGFNTSIGHPTTLAQGYMRQFSSGVSAAGTSVGIPSSANYATSPSEVSRAHTFPAQLANSAASEPLQVTSQSSGDLRRCEWKNNHGDICGTLVGWHCEYHLASAHKIRKIPAHQFVQCGACGEEKKRKFLVRHFREKHLRFRRRKRNAA